jgi:tetratricopeptide (TPR) repeat protein
MAAKVGKQESETSLERQDVTRSRSDQPWDDDEAAKSFESREGASTSGHDLAIGRGTVIGRYTLLERLGAGGMATVYSAHDTQLDRIVALKLLRPHEDVAEVRARLFLEAQAMARLSHPNVVTIYDVGVASDGRVFLSMEIVGGGTLKAWLSEHKRAWPEIVKLLCEAGEGLAAAHGVGIVHRDFKLENVLIGVDGRPRVTDFGVASVTLSVPGASVTGDRRRESVPPPSATPSGSSTMAGAAIGTPGYMAPEQYEGFDEIDERADVFAFSATLYRALYGEGPFMGDSVTAIAAATLAGQVRPPPKGSDVPLWVRRVLLRGLASERAARPRSMPILLAELRADPARRRRRWFAAGAAVLASSAALWTVHASGQKRVRECHAMADRFGGVWDSGRKDRIENAFRATHLVYAADTWSKVERALDGYKASWAAATEQACIATRVRGERSEVMLQLQSACLDSRLDELGALSDVLVSADPKTVETAVRATQVLSTVEACTDLDRVSASAQLPAEPSARAEIRALQGELAAAKALQDAGKPRKSLERLSAVRARVDKTGFGPLLVAWKIRAASDEAEVEMPSATTDFEQAVLLADTHRLDQAKTEALLGLVRDETRAGHYDQSHRWLGLASAAIARIGGDTRLEAVRDISAGWLHVQEGKAAQGVPLFERAIAAARQKHLDDIDIFYAYSGLATALVALGRFDEGFSTYRAGIELAEEELGPLHPSIVRFFFNNLASDQMDAGRINDAVKTASHTVALLDGAVQRGEALPGSRALAIARVTLGQALLRGGKPEGAIEQLRLAREAFKAAADDLVVIADNELAEAERLMGHTAEANNLLNEASAIAAPNGQDSLLLGATLTVKAKIALDRGNSLKALAIAERALAFVEKGQPTIYALADTRLLVARALRARRDDVARTRTLAGQARDAFAMLGDQKRLSEAVALLDETGKR